MLFSNNKLTRDELLSRFFPRYHPVASLSQNGLSGGSVIISDGDQRHVLRQPHDPSAASCYFRRQYRALRQLPARLAPAPLFYSPCWMVVEYCAGEVKSELPACPMLSDLLYDVHQQPRFGWRVTLRTAAGPVLADVRSGTAHAALAALASAAAPPGRAPSSAAGAAAYGRPCRQYYPQRVRPEADRLGICRRWRYRAGAGRGVDFPHQRRQLVAAYARRAAIDAQQLWRQVVLWRPWVLLLMAGWYEMRWQQSGDRQFITLADEIWCQLDNERKG